MWCPISSPHTEAGVRRPRGRRRSAVCHPATAHRRSRHDVVDLVHEHRVVGQFEPVGEVRFEAEPFPDPADGRLGQPASFGYLLTGTSGWHALGRFQSRNHHILDLFGGDDGLRPDRGSSTMPSSRESTNRARQFPTVGIETPSCAATSLFVKPVAQASTIRDRRAVDPRVKWRSLLTLFGALVGPYVGPGIALTWNDAAPEATKPRTSVRRKRHLARGNSAK